MRPCWYFVDTFQVLSVVLILYIYIGEEEPDPLGQNGSATSTPMGLGVTFSSIYPAPLPTLITSLFA